MAAAVPYAAGKSKFSVWFVHTVRQTKICFFRPHKAPPPPRLVWLRPQSWYKLSVRLILKSHSPEHPGRQSAVQTVDLDLVPPCLGTSLPAQPRKMKLQPWVPRTDCPDPTRRGCVGSGRVTEPTRGFRYPPEPTRGFRGLPGGRGFLPGGRRTPVSAEARSLILAYCLFSINSHASVSRFLAKQLSCNVFKETLTRDQAFKRAAPSALLG